MRLTPLIPVAVIMFILYNHYYMSKFRKPKNSMIRNMRFIQLLMQITGDSIEVQYNVLENFFYWHSKEKTLLTLNLCVASFFGLIPVWIIPLRYFIVIGLWAAIA